MHNNVYYPQTPLVYGSPYNPYTLPSAHIQPLPYQTIPAGYSLPPIRAAPV
jgi:hypothetical protein